MIKNGDYEDGDNHWSNNANVSITSEKFSHGGHSLKFNAENFAMSTQTLDQNAPTFGHTYYARLKFKSSSTFIIGDSRFEWFGQGDTDGVNTFIFARKNLQVNDWTLISRISSLRTADYVSNNWFIRNFEIGSNEVNYTDELMLIDLTASYGDNIPTKEELDNTLIYFDDTVYMKSVMGLQGEFKVTGVSDNQEIECNNDGQAKINNGIVTITGDSPYITCYLK